MHRHYPCFHAAYCVLKRWEKKAHPHTPTCLACHNDDQGSLSLVCSLYPVSRQLVIIFGSKAMTQICSAPRFLIKDPSEGHFAFPAVLIKRLGFSPSLIQGLNGPHPARLASHRGMCVIQSCLHTLLHPHLLPTSVNLAKPQTFVAHAHSRGMSSPLPFSPSASHTRVGDDASRSPAHAAIFVHVHAYHATSTRLGIPSFSAM